MAGTNSREASGRFPEQRILRITMQRDRQFSIGHDGRSDGNPIPLKLAPPLSN